MNNKVFTLSLVIAVFAVFMVQSYVSSIEDAAKKKYGSEILVVVAKTDIAEMATIDETMLELKPFPKAFLEPNAFSFAGKGDEKEGSSAEKEMKSLSGTVAIVPLKAGEQLTANKIMEPGLRTGLSPQITPGKRAMAIPVSEVTGVSKLIKPGDRIDLLAVLDVNREKIVKTVLQDVSVLAVGKTVTNNISRLLEKDGFTGKTRVRSMTAYDGFSTITLEVEASQAQLIALLLGMGSNNLVVSLRHNDDTDRVPLAGSSMRDLLGAEASLLMRGTASVPAAGGGVAAPAPGGGYGGAR